MKPLTRRQWAAEIAWWFFILGAPLIMFVWLIVAVIRDGGSG